MKDEFGRILSRDLCSEDCIYLHDLSNRLIAGNEPIGHTLKSVADLYRQLLTLLYEQGHDPFADPPHRAIPL